MKVCTGSGLAVTVLVLALYEAAFYAGAYMSMALVIALSDGVSLAEAVSNIAETPAADSIMPFAPAFINCLLLLVPSGQNAPGGKLFRTIKGGFDTFGKSRIGICLSSVLAVLIFCLFALLLDLSGLAKTQHPFLSQTAVFVSSLPALAAGTLARMIKNDTVRAAATVLLCFAVNTGGTILLNIQASLGSDMLPHIVTGAAGAVLLITAARLYLSYYKKQLWKS